MAKSARRRYCRLTIHERVVIETRYCRDRRSPAAIARETGRHRSTILEEIKGRPRKGRGRYDARRSQKEAEKKKRRGRPSVMAYEPLRKQVTEKLEMGWSPEQIAMRLPHLFPEDTALRVSHETIYTYIYRQIHRNGHGTVKNGCTDLRSLLPRQRKRRIRKGARKTKNRERTQRLPSIEQLPEEAQQRTVVGHWQGDTVVSRKSGVRVKSVNELTTGIVFFEKTKDGTATACNEVTVHRLKEIPRRYRKTLLQDRGSENMHWEQIARATGISCYFAHPYCSHERGANENTNGLLRRYFPKGTDFGEISTEDIARAEYLINTRPRKRLNGLTPYEVFYNKTGIDLEPVAYSKMTGVALGG